jgi:indole-3-glycerol phosphate synthase
MVGAAQAKSFLSMAASDKLQEIVRHKRDELAALLPRAERLRHAALERNDFRSLYDALKNADPQSGGLALVAEVKKASPSAGAICADADPVEVGRTYDRAGASAISVLTDEKYFGGRLEYLTQVRREVAVPCLRKDFIVHQAQVWEAAVAGADAVLLIVACLAQDELVHLLEVASVCGLEALVEVHDAAELDRALETDAAVIGVNNRDLKTFAVDLGTTAALAEQVPDEVVLVSESGIRTAEDARFVESCGADAVLVGEALMRSPDVAASVRDLMGARHAAWRGVGAG